jgi:hypothetical protein
MDVINKTFTLDEQEYTIQIERNYFDSDDGMQSQPTGRSIAVAPQPGTPAIIFDYYPGLLESVTK